VTPFWISAFLDCAPDAFDDASGFWRDVTGHTLSPLRGEHDEFATLVPPHGDDHLRLQRLGSGSSRIHLDLHVPSPREAADRATSLGASEVADLGYVVLASPGGLPFCFVDHPASAPAPAATWPGGHRSAVDQVCIDIPAEHHGREVAFWRDVTGRELVESPGYPEFQRLVRPAGQAMHLLVQRLDEPAGEVRAHLDLATTDRPAEVARHVGLGATVTAELPDWTTLVDRTGSAYCVTTREPVG
jgi:hypothetical protein